MLTEVGSHHFGLLLTYIMLFLFIHFFAYKVHTPQGICLSVYMCVCVCLYYVVSYVCSTTSRNVMARILYMYTTRHAFYHSIIYVVFYVTMAGVLRTEQKWDPLSLFIRHWALQILAKHKRKLQKASYFTWFGQTQPTSMGKASREIL